MGTKAEEFQSQIGELEEFLSELEKIGLAAPSPVKLAIEAIKVGKDVALSAEEVKAWLEIVNADLHGACVDSANRALGKGWEATDQAYVCIAKVDRQWLKRSASATLYFNDDKTVVRRFWERFKNSLVEWTSD